MLFKKECNTNPDNQNLFIDIDDVMSYTSQALLEVFKEIGRQKNTPPSELNYLDMQFSTTWDMRLFRQILDIPIEEFQKIFDSDLFWKHFKLNPKMVALVKKYYTRYNIFFITKANEFGNIEKKVALFSEVFKDEWPQLGFYGLPIDISKGVVPMQGAIQIDDNYNVLKETDASIKIMYGNKDLHPCISSEYNSMECLDATDTNLYIVHYEDEIDEILGFNLTLRLDDDTIGKSYISKADAGIATGQEKSGRDKYPRAVLGRTKGSNKISKDKRIWVESIGEDEKSRAFLRAELPESKKDEDRVNEDETSQDKISKDETSKDIDKVNIGTSTEDISSMETTLSTDSSSTGTSKD